MRAISLVLLLAAGCATTGPSKEVKVEGSDIDVTLLAGRWEGTYEGTESGRKGKIEFELRAGNRWAEGTVLMNALAAPQAAKPLPIKLVETSGARVSGKLEKYMDPQCNCEVETEFTGVRKGRHIEGSFVTTVQATQQHGTWAVDRR